MKLQQILKKGFKFIESEAKWDITQEVSLTFEHEPDSWNETSNTRRITYHKKHTGEETIRIRRPRCCWYSIDIHRESDGNLRIYSGGADNHPEFIEELKLLLNGEIKEYLSKALLPEATKLLEESLENYSPSNQ